MDKLTFHLTDGFGSKPIVVQASQELQYGYSMIDPQDVAKILTDLLIKAGHNVIIKV